jgi:ketosteroid isomerase-like protein
MSANLKEKGVSQEHKRAQTAERLLRSLLDGAPDTALIAPDFEYEQHFGFTAGLYVGETGLRRWLETFYEVWDRASAEFDGARETADRVGLDTRVLVRARQTGMEVELRSTGIFQFAGDGRITRVDSFNDPRVAAERLAEERG